MTHLESELKFRAESDDALHILATPRTLGPAELGPARVINEVDLYLDTKSGDLARAGWAARLRTRDGVTRISLKGPPQHADGATLHERQELEGPAGSGLDPSAWPRSPAAELLAELTGGTALAERLRLNQRRVEREVMLDDRRVGLLSLDYVRVLHAGGEVGALRVVELELAPEALAAGLDPEPFERALAAQRGLTPDPASKLEHGLRLLEASQ